MIIEKLARFADELSNILDFIALDNPRLALQFQQDLLLQIDKIPQNPLSFRQSNLFDDKNIRELIFKGYIIIFKIQANNIVVLGIFSTNIWEH
ncbi:MAG: type II toxin-antitoxin system RelE/ParE family toxin [Candidatus Thioglobus sp.]|nr:type II toxin-antitoxin system RelE/ParE family toxin [Candidatus Thioglobus sp.]